MTTYTVVHVTRQPRTATPIRRRCTLEQAVGEISKRRGDYRADNYRAHVHEAGWYEIREDVR